MRSSTFFPALLLLVVVLFSLLSLSLADPDAAASSPFVFPRPEPRLPRDSRDGRFIDPRERERLTEPMRDREGGPLPRFPAGAGDVHADDPRLRPADMLGDVLMWEAGNRRAMTPEEQRAVVTAASKAEKQFEEDIARGPLTHNPSSTPHQRRCLPADTSVC